ncbi:PEP-CTERM sorting domain-containing protein [Verrucomicrobiota bacterium]
MKKIVMIIVMGMTFGAVADISLQWNAGGYVQEHNLTWDEYTGLAQLIWSSEDPTSHFGNYTIADGLDKSGTEILLETYATSWNYLAADGTAAVLTDADVGGADINSGYLLVRLYDTPSVVEGSYYYQSTIVQPTLMEYSALDITTIYDIDATGGEQVIATIEAIPEPATMMIFGPGIAGLLAYRRRKFGLRNQLVDMFESSQTSVATTSVELAEAEAAEREVVDHWSTLAKVLVKPARKAVKEQFDPLGDMVVAIGNRFSK